MSSYESQSLLQSLINPHREIERQISVPQLYIKNLTKEIENITRQVDEK